MFYPTFGETIGLMIVISIVLAIIDSVSGWSLYSDLMGWIILGLIAWWILGLSFGLSGTGTLLPSQTVMA